MTRPPLGYIARRYPPLANVTFLIPRQCTTTSASELKVRPAPSHPQTRAYSNLLPEITSDQSSPRATSFAQITKVCCGTRRTALPAIAGGRAMGRGRVAWLLPGDDLVGSMSPSSSRLVAQARAFDPLLPPRWRWCPERALLELRTTDYRRACVPTPPVISPYRTTVEFGVL